MALRQAVAERISAQIARTVPEPHDMTYVVSSGTRTDKPLTIGYVSPDFRAHSVAVAFRGIIDHHDRERFRFKAYSLHPGKPDALTDYFRGTFDEFRDCAGLSHEEVASKINADGVDILIDLAGHTRGTRLEIFALRPAPIQAHYLGYSATIGARFIDYLITDHQQVPAEQRPYFTEQLVYLPDTFMAARQSEIATTNPCRADYGLPDDGVVFANFNKHYKLEPQMFGISMRLLKKIPGSVYWLREGTAKSVENLRREAAARGVDPERLIFASLEPHPQHLARLALADLALDNLFHGGGVTTVDALWVGLPVLTLAGETPQSRNGASLLAPIGLPELIVNTVNAFEAKALQLASDAALRADIRQRLLANRLTYPLFDIQRLTQHLERAYEMMWHNHASGKPPHLIDVPKIG